MRTPVVHLVLLLAFVTPSSAQDTRKTDDLATLQDAWMAAAG